MADDEHTTAAQEEEQTHAQGETQSSPDSQSQASDIDDKKLKGKAKEASPEGSTTPADDAKEGSEKYSNSNPAYFSGESGNASAQQFWQAIFSPQYNAYYFHNSQTGETTWTNPLQPSDSRSASTEPVSGPPTDAGSASPTTDQLNSSHYSALQQAALAQGIDPSLAHLDPALIAATTSGASGAPLTFQAKFNARTGAFARPDARTPGHLSEYERMKRMSEFYFDVNAWEQQVAQEKAEEEQDGSGKKRKRPSKKDLERFKEQKRLKKIAKTAWLRT